MICLIVDKKKMEKTMLVNVLADLVGNETEKRKRLKKIWRRGTPSVVSVLFIDKKVELEHTYYITF